MPTFVEQAKTTNSKTRFNKTIYRRDKCRYTLKSGQSPTCVHHVRYSTIHFSSTGNELISPSGPAHYHSDVTTSILWLLIIRIIIALETSPTFGDKDQYSFILSNYWSFKKSIFVISRVFSNVLRLITSRPTVGPLFTHNNAWTCIPVWGHSSVTYRRWGWGGVCLIFWKKALRRCNVQCY